MARLVVAFLVVAVPQVLGHGRLIEPPSRASAWRYGFNTPHNYNDHELFCGGFGKQWNANGGKCGVCGDAWDAKVPRAHEYGGTYGQGVVVRNYGVGNTITIRVELTASHMGYFTFTICEDYKNTTQECLDKHFLKTLRPQVSTQGIFFILLHTLGTSLSIFRHKYPGRCPKNCSNYILCRSNRSRRFNALYKAGRAFPSN